MKSLIAALFLTASPIVGAEGIELGEVLPDISKGVAHFELVAPRLMKAVEVILDANCPPPVAASPESKLARACRFREIANLHAGFATQWSKWTSLKIPHLGIITYNPSATEFDWRAGIWNPDPSNPDEVAFNSALAYTRFLVSRHALQASFEDVADWVQTLGNGERSRFRMYHRPIISAWLRSSSPLARLGALSEQMDCGAPQHGCRAIKKEVARLAFRALQTLQPALYVLDQIDANSQFHAVLQLDSELNHILSMNSTTLLSWLKDNEFEKLPHIQSYVKKLAAIAKERKNLMPGAFSLADEMVALVVLCDIKRFANHVGSLDISDEGLELSVSSKRNLKEMIDVLAPELDGFVRGTESLIQMVSNGTDRI